MKAGLPVAAQPPGLDPPRMKLKQHWSHGKENDCGGTFAGAEVQGWESAAWRIAWPEGRVAARSAFQTPAASRLGHNGCTPPSRSHHGRDTGQKWTCLGGEWRGVVMRRLNTMDAHLSGCRRYIYNIIRQLS